ncbi:MAG: serine hydrolase [Bariatricus sp.]
MNRIRNFISVICIFITTINLVATPQLAGTEEILHALASDVVWQEINQESQETAQEEDAAVPLPEELRNLHALSAVLMDADSRRVLISKDGETMRPMASTTKIMTCILALEAMNEEKESAQKEIVTVSKNAASQPKVHLQMAEGEQYYLEDLLYSLMLESHNDSAVAIAEHIAGSVEQFAGKMNEKAKEIGCTNAHFITPNGLDAEDDGGKHSISAADLARIMSYCILESPKAEEFLEITQQKSYSFSNVEGTRNFTCTNHNLFLDMMEGALSGKTGFTGEAGYCYVGALEDEGRTFVVALLGCGWPNNKSYKWTDTKKLMQYALNTYQYRDVWQEPVLREITVENGIPDNQDLFGEAKAAPILLTEEGEKEELQILLSESEQVDVTVCQEETMQAPIAKGTKAGYVRYTLNGELLKEYPLVIQEDIPVKNYAWVFRKIFEKYEMIN